VPEFYDLAIIGGGINGCGIARDAAGRGLDVFLCEQGDLAGATSSASTKLIHGGLRYLEYRAFRLVREALEERELLWRMAPHLITPARFVLPHHRGLRPAWLLRLGLMIYDRLGGRRLLPPTRVLDLRNDAAGEALKPGYRKAFEYSDCRVDDARLVIANAIDARDRGATIRTRTRCIRATRQGGLWHLVTEDLASGTETEIVARILINAAGPWVNAVLEQVIGLNTPAHVRMVQGSHIVVPRLFSHERCYMFQGGDGRIVFALPYEGAFTLIGTTDRDYHGDPAMVAASEDEIAYLARAASEYFKTPVHPDDVVWHYSGVRPLYDDGASKAAAATRDYLLELDAPKGQPALISVFGGKITTYRRLAEAAL
jgi:glycerol-3-phosphate dehydrogenase